MPTAVTLLDGPMGTQLEARGIELRLPGWSGHAISDAPEVVRAVHREYAGAGCAAHRANSWRCRRGAFPEDWVWRAARAVELCRESVPAGTRVLGSFGPIADCYRPDLSPGAASRPRHREFLEVLSAARPDGLIGETFANVEEGLTALEEALATGLSSWVSFTPGYRADLMTPADIRAAARTAAGLGAGAVLVNCVPAIRAVEYVDAIVDGCAGACAVGVYANAGDERDGLGWGAESGGERYADVAMAWVAHGASIVGGCCGTGPAHTAAIATRIGRGEV